jgi:hypothetical protein
MKSTTTNIILVQTNVCGSYQYRIAKLVGAVHVHTMSNPHKDYHVGDVIDEQTANDLAANSRAYTVTITEKGGAK